MKKILKLWLSVFSTLTQPWRKQKYSPLFIRIGGEKAIQKLVADFYHVMDTDDHVKALRDIHSPDLTDAENKLFLFLVGWLGGPPLFSEKYGHPRLRQRHLGFKIDTRMVSQWLYCMNKALTDSQLDHRDQDTIYQALSQLAHHMTNHHQANSTNPEV